MKCLQGSDLLLKEPFSQYFQYFFCCLFIQIYRLQIQGSVHLIVSMFPQLLLFWIISFLARPFISSLHKWFCFFFLCALFIHCKICAFGITIKYWSAIRARLFGYWLLILVCSRYFLRMCSAQRLTVTVENLRFKIMLHLFAC